MLKKLIILLLAIAPLALIAQESKIAYINSQELFGMMPELSAIETQLNTKQEQIKKNATALEAEYNTKMEEFQKSTDCAVTKSIKRFHLPINSDNTK